MWAASKHSAANVFYYQDNLKKTPCPSHTNANKKKNDIMENRDPFIIAALPLTTRESDHRSRHRLGFHVYLSRYFDEFNNNITEGEQRDLLKRYTSQIGKQNENENRHMIVVIEDEESVDESSVDSTNTLYTGKVGHRDALKIACHNWSTSLSAEIKEAWKKRANMLNLLPIHGNFEKVPAAIGGRTDENANDELELNIVRSLSIEWHNTFKIFKQCIMREPKASLSYREYWFGHERVKFLSQSFRTFTIPLLLRLCIFGREYCHLKAHEVIRKTKRVALIHISSQERMEELFSLQGRCAIRFDVEVDRIVACERTCSGKVNMMIGKRSINGYILKEVHDRWQIQLENNKKLWMTKVKYDAENNRYEYAVPHGNTNKKYMTMYWPIRMLINDNGHCKMTLNKVSFESGTGNIVSQHTT